MSESVQALENMVDRHRQQQQHLIDKLRDKVDSFKVVQSEVRLFFVDVVDHRPSVCVGSRQRTDGVG